MASYVPTGMYSPQQQTYMNPQPGFGQQLAQIGLQSTFSGLGTGVGKYAQGSIDEALKQQAMQEMAQSAPQGGLSTGEQQVIGGLGGAVSGASTGAMVGQAAIPIPGVGAGIGALAGGLISGLGGALIPMFFEEDEPEQIGPPPEAFAQFAPIPINYSGFNQQQMPTGLSAQYGVQNPLGFS